MRLMLILLLLSVSALAEEAIEIPLTENTTDAIQYQWTWLSIARFQTLTDNEQDVVVVTSRDFLALSMHSMNQHRTAGCVKTISEDEMRAIKNAALLVTSDADEFTHSVVARISNRLFGLCIIPRLNKQKQNKDSVAT